PDHRRVLTLLAKGPTDLPKRQLSMRATLTWSHRLLDAADQVLFRRLGTFPGSFSLDAAEATAGSADPAAPPGEGDTQPDDVLNGIAEMVDLHLVEPMDSAAGDPERIRFVMSDVARAFAAELLAASDEGPAVRVRLVRWCRDLVARADRGLASIDEQLWLDRLDQEMPIIRQCLTACAADGQGLLGLQLSVGLGRYWCLRGSTTEGARWCQLFLDTTASDGDPAVGRAALDRARTAAMGWWSRLAIGSADLTRIGTNLRSMRLARPAIEPACSFEWLSWTDNLILSLLSVGQAAECADLIIDGLRAAEDRRDPYWTCVFLLHRALWRWTSVGQREDRMALLWAEMAYMAAADNGLYRVAARAMSLTAMNMMARRNWSGARELMTESLDGLRRGGDTRSYAVSLNCLGAIMIELDRPQEAARYLVEAIAEAKRSDDRLGEIGAAWAVSFLACRLGRHADIAVAHDAVADHLGLLERLLPATVLDDYRLAVADSAPAAAARTEVGWDTPAWIWLRGWALGIATDVAARQPADQVKPPIQLPRPDEDQIDSRGPTQLVPVAALQERDRPRAGPRPAEQPATKPHDLTARELEILEAIASGRTNAQIATDFFLSTKTVMHHSVSIYRKLEVRSRTEAVALAYRTGLLQAPVG
ncbi:MAG TPA: LuxR C-terminal-related transcriptional regulator, partial [Nakamurella sp.]